VSLALPRRYAIDTNLYIDAIRTESGKIALGQFYWAFTPWVHLCSVVAHELLAGVRGSPATKLDESLLAPFERRGRVFAPSASAWKEAGRVLGELVVPSAWKSVSRSFVNDVLLSMACRETGTVLVTSNARDFARIAKVRAFDFVTDWPRR